MSEARPQPAPLAWESCPVCAARERDLWVGFAELEFVRCRGCGVVYKAREQPALRPPDFYEASYFHGRKSGRDRRFEHRVGKATRQIRAALEVVEGKSLLDVGCSLGYVVEAGRRLGLASAGMDISQYAVGVCRERGLRAEVGTLERLPFADGEFDIVVMKHVLEHTPAPLTALAEVRRVCGPGGAVVIAVPDLAYWKGSWRRRQYRYFRPDDLGRQHYVYYTPATLSRLLASAGFTVTHASKAVFHARGTAGRPARRLLEACRFAGVAAAQGVAAALRLRREVFVVARRE